MADADDDVDVVDEDDDRDNVNLGTNCGGADVDSSSPLPPVVEQFSDDNVGVCIDDDDGGGGGLTIGLIVSFGIGGAGCCSNADGDDNNDVGNLMMVLIGSRSRFKLILSGSTLRCCLHIVSELVVVDEDGDVDVDEGADVVDDRESDAELSSTSTMSSISTVRCWCCCCCSCCCWRRCRWFFSSG